MDTQTATLVAATIGATIAVINTIVSSYKDFAIKRADALRTFVSQDAKKMGELLRSMIAMGSTGLRCKTGESKNKWNQEFQGKCDEISKVRIEMVYTLYDIDKFIRTLARTSGRLSHHIEDVDRIAKIMTIVDDMRYHIDKTLLRSIYYGKSIGVFRQSMLCYYNRLLLSYWLPGPVTSWHVSLRIWMRFPFGWFIKGQFKPEPNLD